MTIPTIPNFTIPAPDNGGDFPRHVHQCDQPGCPFEGMMICAACDFMGPPSGLDPCPACGNYNVYLRIRLIQRYRRWLAQTVVERNLGDVMPDGGRTFTLTNAMVVEMIAKMIHDDAQARGNVS